MKRWRDRLRRRVAIWLWDRPSPVDADGPFQNRIVFIRWDAKLGDTIVLSWVFRELQRQRPDLEIVAITGESFEDLFRQGFCIDSVYLAGKRHDAAGLKRIAREVKRPYAVVHLSVRWRPRDIRFVGQLGARYVVALDDELELVNVKLGAQTQGVHFSEKLIPWLEQIGVDTSRRHYWIPRTPQASARVDSWWPKGKVVGLCPFGASQKKYLNEAWIEFIVCALLAEQANVVFLVLPAQKSSVQQLITAKGWQQRVFINPGQSTQYDLFEQVARCDAVVSVDTAVVHIAVGFDRPLLALYNSESSEFESWHPNSSLALTLRCKADLSESDNGLNETELSQAIKSLLAVH